MISVEEALARLLTPLVALPPEQVSVADAVGRVLAEDVAARRTQPPFAVSAMDGYAVRADDVAKAAIFAYAHDAFGPLTTPEARGRFLLRELDRIKNELWQLFEYRDGRTA